MKAIALMILVGVIILAMLLSKTEAFIDRRVAQDAQSRYDELTKIMPTPEGPAANAPINDVDDYDVQFVDQVSGWHKINDRTAKELTRRTRLNPDWSDLPNDANEFQVKRQDFVDGVYKAPIPDDSVFKRLEGGDVQPPDQTQLDAEEAKLMASYAPKHSSNLTTYSAEDAKDFINKFYEKQGKVAEIVEDPKFPNVYQVVGVQDKNPKIVWEPAAPSSPDAVESLGEDTINVPNVVVERADPFFFGEGKGYKSWTPGLERMFAPTYSKSSWY